MIGRTDDPRLIFSTFALYRRWVTTLIPTVIPDIDVSYQQLNVLYYVRVSDYSMAEIARVLGVAPTVITGLVDRLEARGLIRREAHPNDRRRIQLVLTELGHEISTKVEDAIALGIDRRIRAFDSEQQQHLRAGLVLLSQMMQDLESEVSQNELAGTVSARNGSID